MCIFRLKTCILALKWMFYCPVLCFVLTKHNFKCIKIIVLKSVQIFVADYDYGIQDLIELRLVSKDSMRSVYNNLPLFDSLKLTSSMGCLGQSIKNNLNQSKCIIHSVRQNCLWILYRPLLQQKTNIVKYWYCLFAILYTSNERAIHGPPSNLMWPASYVGNFLNSYFDLKNIKQFCNFFF